MASPLLIESSYYTTTKKLAKLLNIVCKYTNFVIYMAKKVQNTVQRKKSRPRKGKSRKKKEIKITIWTIIIICIVLGLCIILPYISERHIPDKGASVPEGSYIYGIDISHYQTDVVWDSLMVLTDASGRTIKSMLNARDIKPVSFVFIKATEGSTMKDKHFRKHWKNAGANAIRRGAYHFFRSSKDAEMQAKNFIKTVGELEPTDLPPVLDIETIHQGCSHKALNDKALLWLETVEEHYGRKPIVYSSASFIEDILCSEIKHNYPIWVAHYRTDRPRCAEWKLWQFTDQAVVYGVGGYVDLNVCSSDFLKGI